MRIEIQHSSDILRHRQGTIAAFVLSAIPEIVAVLTVPDHSSRDNELIVIKIDLFGKTTLCNCF